jgi:hypothetical protein
VGYGDWRFQTHRISNMPANPFDQGARYAAKLDPPGFIAWLMPDAGSALTFHNWLDTRSIPFPGDPDRTCDTVAALRESTNDASWWAMPIEFQTRPDALLFGRILEYLARLWLELRSPGKTHGRFQVAAAVVNLTGTGNTSRDMVLDATGARTCLAVVERNLREENAGETLTLIANGRTARCILPFIPLMRGGDKPGIIVRWKELAHADPDARRRADYAGLALVFADLTDCRSVWQRHLEGWNVEVSMQVLEWQEAAAKRATLKTKIEAVLRVLRKRLDSPIPSEMEETIRGAADLKQLDRWLDAAADSSTLAEFRRLARLDTKRNGRRKGSKTNGTGSGGA